MKIEDTAVARREKLTLWAFGLGVGAYVLAWLLGFDLNAWGDAPASREFVVFVAFVVASLAHWTRGAAREQRDNDELDAAVEHALMSTHPVEKPGTLSDRSRNA